MNTKEPFVKVATGFYLKNAPKGHLGLRNEQWNFGNKPWSLEQLIFGLVYRLSLFYASVLDVPISDLNEQIEKASKRIAELKFEESDG